jgi:hypothetical protein
LNEYLAIDHHCCGLIPANAGTNKVWTLTPNALAIVSAGRVISSVAIATDKKGSTVGQ